VRIALHLGFKIASILAFNENHTHLIENVNKTMLTVAATFRSVASINRPSPIGRRRKRTFTQGPFSFVGSKFYLSAGGCRSSLLP
jgi:hypothetical protein